MSALSKIASEAEDRRRAAEGLARQHEEEARHYRLLLAELYEAIEPFAKLHQPETVGYMDGSQPDDRAVYEINKASITLGDIREAARLHARLTETTFL